MSRQCLAWLIVSALSVLCRKTGNKMTGKKEACTFSTSDYCKNTVRFCVSMSRDKMLCSCKYKRSMQQKSRYHKITVQLWPQRAGDSPTADKKWLRRMSDMDNRLARGYIYTVHNSKRSEQTKIYKCGHFLQRTTYKNKFGEKTFSKLPKHIRNCNPQNIPFQAILKPVLSTRHQLSLQKQDKSLHAKPVTFQLKRISNVYIKYIITFPSIIV